MASSEVSFSWSGLAKWSEMERNSEPMSESYPSTSDYLKFKFFYAVSIRASFVVFSGAC